MKTGLRITLTAGLLIWAVSAPAEAGRSGRVLPVSVDPASIDNTSAIGVNNLQMLVSNVGSFAYDPSQHFGKTDGLYFPRGTDRTVIFAAGLWVGATVNGAPRLALAEHATEFSPGGMANGTFQPDVGRFHVYQVTRSDDALSNPDYANWPYDDGAPALQAADGSDSLDAAGNRIPLVLGDEALYSIYNDANPAGHNNAAGSTLPLGIEVQQYVFAYARSAALGNSIYLKFKIINKGANLLEDTYVGIWCDADVGDAFDDLVGCDTVLGLGYAYNEGPDAIYGTEAPAVGFDFFRGPMVPSPGDSVPHGGGWLHDVRHLPMTVFSNYDNGVDPQNAIEAYNLMQGLEFDGTPVVDDAGNTTTFQFAGDPVADTGWVDAGGDDRRFLMSSGPFTMAPGDTQEVVVAVLVGQGADHLGSVADIKEADGQVQAVFDLNFQIPFPPPQPHVWQQPLDGRIELVWDSEAEGDVQESEILGQRFVMEGYNVYQGQTQTGPWKRIATFDVDNNVTKIYRDRFDPNLGAMQRVLVQSGSNNGLKNHLTINSDRFTGRGLVDHNPYYFAVTAYSYDELNLSEYKVGSNAVGYLTEDLETRIQGIEVIPASLAHELVVTADHTAGGSEGTVTTRVMDPTIVTTGDYRVTFNEDLTWNLDNLTTATRLLTDQDNSSGDYTYDMTEGLMVQVVGPDPDIKDATWSGSEPPWVTSVYWGGRFFGGGLEMGDGFFGSSIQDPKELIPVEIRFSPTNTQNGYVYTRGADPNYGYSGWGTLPLTAWDVSVDPPRQLNVCFVEQFGLASANRQWLPPDGEPLGGREYLFILNSDYTGTPDDYYTSRSILFDASEIDVLYAWWPTVAEGHSNAELAAGQILRIDVNKYNTADDQFDFSVRGADAGAAAGTSLGRIHPVPNPWLHGHDDLNGGTLDGIKFTGLPLGPATVEIYDLAGELISTVKKTDPNESFVLWDVRTDHGLPPASGLYVYRVIVPGVGTHTGRLALIMEEERLREF